MTYGANAYGWAYYGQDYAGEQDTPIPPLPVECGGGGYGAVMARRHFERYQVHGKWRGVERVRATPARRSRSTSRSR